MKVYCNQCGKYLFSSEKENPGAVGAEAQQLGFIYKNACLFSDKYYSLYFCNHTCGKQFYAANIPRNPEITEAINELKKGITKNAELVAEKMQKLIKEFENPCSK